MTKRQRMPLERSSRTHLVSLVCVPLASLVMLNCGTAKLPGTAPVAGSGSDATSDSSTESGSGTGAGQTSGAMQGRDDAAQAAGLPPPGGEKPAGTPGSVSSVPESLKLELPIEIFGREGTQTTVALNLDQAQVQAAKRLWLQTHNIRYPQKASVKVNNGKWIDLNNVSAEMHGTSKTYGGVGGSLATLKMSVPLEKADLKVGENSVTFRFNKSDSHSMGYRIVKLNVLDASGKKLIAEEGFRESLPSSWTPPSNASADIEAGKQLWMNRNLVSSYLPGAVPIKAKCASCHTTTGFDLKYFGFSNLSIVERSKFHGMTQKEGEQVASYIRSLPVKAVGRPWNPPYQPGPGTSSKPNSEWAAGAGIDHVLDEDWDTIKHIFPDGIKRSAIVEGDTNNIKRFSAHDTPIALQLPDWNHWLPEIHPLDAFGEEWTAKWQDLNHFNKISEQLKGKSAAEIKNWYATSSTNNGGTRFPTGYFAFRDWPDTLKDIADAASQDSGEDANGRFKDPLVAQKIYAMRVFRLVKIFELQEEFQLTGMGPEVRGAWWIGLDEKQTLPRAWIGIDRVVFDTSPFLSALPSPVTGSNSGNNSFNYDYLSNSWYTLQLLLNGGQRGAGSHRAVDFGYAHGFMSGMNASTGYNMNGHAVMWELRGMDEADNGNLPGPHGWSFRRTGLSALNIAPLSEGEKHPFWFGRATPESKAVLSVLQQVNAEKMASWLPEQYVTRDGAPFNPSEDGGNWEDKNFKLEGNYDPETHHRSAALKTWKFLRLAKAEKILHPALINARLNFGLAMWPGLNSSGVPTNPWLSVRETVGAAPAAPTASVTGEARRKRTGQSDLVRKVVTVQWKSAPGFKTYNVKRSDNPNGPFLTVAFFRDSGSFKDETPLPGRTYYYRMSGNTDASESSDSASATVVVSP